MTPVEDIMTALISLETSLANVPKKDLLTQSPSVQYVEKFNRMRAGALAAYPDLENSPAFPPKLSVGPSGNLEQSWAEILADAVALRAMLRSRQIETGKHLVGPIAVRR